VRYVVDTNIAIAMLAQRQLVTQRVSGVPAGELGLSVLVVAELLFGAHRSKRIRENVAHKVPITILSRCRLHGPPG
jgi:tRNA(fMet)-specific endonuclease VapC